MRSSRSPSQILTTLLVGALLVLQGMVVPALETTDAGPRVVLESKHDASCLVGHDHSICIQTAANRSLTAAAVPQSLPVVTVALQTPQSAGRRHSSSPITGGRPRAPPIA
jgi:hypothetical protein